MLGSRRTLVVSTTVPALLRRGSLYPGQTCNKVLVRRLPASNRLLSSLRNPPERGVTRITEIEFRLFDGTEEIVVCPGRLV